MTARRLSFQLLLAFVLGTAALAAPTAFAQPGQAQGEGAGRGMRGGMGGFPGGGRGVLGTVTDVAADHYVIKTDTGDSYTVFYSVNTRIMKAGQGGRRRQGQNANQPLNPDEAPAAPPQPLKPTEIKVGDIITAGGQMDASAKTIGAVFIALIDPERAKQMREMQANYGKTWLAGRITAIDGTTIAIEGILDHKTHQIAVDENTSFHDRRDSVTLADIHPGEELRAEGAVKDGVFLASQVNASQPRDRDQAPGASAPPQ